MTKNTDYYPVEDQESDGLLNVSKNFGQGLPLATKPTKKCNKSCRRAKRVFSFLVGFLAIPLIFYVYFYGFNSPFHFSNFNTVYPPRYGKCEATIDWAESSESFDPKEVTGLGIFFKQSITNPTVSFKRSAQTNITIDYIIKASSEVAGKESELSITKSKDLYSWSAKGPNSWRSHSNDCISANVVITLPETLTDFGRLVIEGRTTANPGKVDFNLDFGGKLNLEELKVFTPNAELRFNGQKVDHLRIETVSGDIEVSDVQANTAELKTVNGNIKASKVSAIKFSGDNTSGDVYANLSSSDHATAHTVNGNAELEVEAIDPNSASSTQYKSNSLNGDASLKVPTSFLGRFSTKTLNGKTELQIDGDASNVHVTFKSSRRVTGYTGETEKSGNFSEVNTLNGNAKLHFF
jgi:hypothetical protein